MKKLVALLALLVVGAGGFAGYHWLQSPATSTVTPEPSKPAAGILGAATALVPWQTMYFKTQIPDSLRIRTTNEDNVRDRLGTYLLTSTSAKISDQVGVTVATLGNNSLSEIPGVKVRLNAPAQYTQASRSYAPDGAYVFTTPGNTETSVFWQHDGSYAAVVVSGTADRSAYLEQALSSIVRNWEWK